MPKGGPDIATIEGLAILVSHKAERPISVVSVTDRRASTHFTSFCSEARERYRLVNGIGISGGSASVGRGGHKHDGNHQKRTECHRDDRFGLHIADGLNAFLTNAFCNGRRGQSRENRLDPGVKRVTVKAGRLEKRPEKWILALELSLSTD